MQSPNLAKDRTLMLDCTVAQSKIEDLLPARIFEAIDKPEPRRTAPRTDKQDPASTRAKQETAEPNLK
jgi:hypothetical protein